MSFFTIDTEQRESWTETDVAKAFWKFVTYGFVRYNKDGRPYWTASIQDALKLLADESTTFPETLTICWLLDEGSSTRNDSEVDKLALRKAVANAMQEIREIRQVMPLFNLNFGGGTCENN